MSWLAERGRLVVFPSRMDGLIIARNFNCGWR